MLKFSSSHHIILSVIFSSLEHSLLLLILIKVMDLPSVAMADASKPAKQESREVKQERQIEEYKV